MERTNTGSHSAMTKVCDRISYYKIHHFFMWFTLWMVFVYLNFGSVFFMLSLFPLLCMTLGDRKRVEGEPSAYSVFNPECKRLPSILDREDFEDQVRYGALHHV